MSDRPEKPANWDWVAARRKCSAATVFESLVLAAKENVDAMAVVQEGRSLNHFRFFHSGRSFSVSRDNFHGQIGVRVYLQDEQILAQSNGGKFKVDLTARVTLNDNGECRLRVVDEELQEWQFLKRALEPLLFAPSDW